jgi:hypothetical protein
MGRLRTLLFRPLRSQEQAAADAKKAERKNTDD